MVELLVQLVSPDGRTSSQHTAPAYTTCDLPHTDINLCAPDWISFNLRVITALIKVHYSIIYVDLLYLQNTDKNLHIL